ncbi:acetylornithine aminotransferase [Thermopolyspora flexuosa]|uniref:Acetylornithine aminotransferase n=1 Tax=Thermopolyspora flexuosa TaxID=103836 RepID=A0A543IXF4_9ACTN|nr:acetylornithine transaminase [Thermopolyspora flexuosa]TQM75258.1 acetylornithine aminotransferase [Thermopolyspora flexuosa]GGM91224.1 acetylornithine aminotransferase [Thermopolyspora flexuosa]
MSRNEDLLARHQAALMPTYAPQPVALVRGEGPYVWDADGNRYLDLIGGIAVNALGHNHPALVGAVTAQVSRIAHTSNLFVNEPSVLLAERLQGLLGGDCRVFLTNSGTEANECAYKLVIKHGKANGRRYIVAAENGFHGRTTGALSLTGKASIREPFGPFPVEVRFVPYGDADALKQAVTDECAAVFLEPTLGEAGVVPPPEGYLRTAREICDATGALFVMDEIQSGVGRTGHWFAHQAENVRPDIVTLAKGLGGGLPIGACAGFGPAGTIFGKGDHGSTFGGNPVACAAALAVLDTIEKENLLAHATRAAEHLHTGLAGIDHPLLRGVRGRGLWLAAVLTEPVAGRVEEAARSAGFLVNAVQPDAVRLAPPLVTTLDQLTSFVDAFPAILTQAATPPTTKDPS